MAVIIALVAIGLGYLVFRVAQGKIDAPWLRGGLRLPQAEAQVKGRRARAAMPPPQGLAVYVPQPGGPAGSGWYRPGDAHHEAQTPTVLRVPLVPDDVPQPPAQPEAGQPPQ